MGTEIKNLCRCGCGEPCNLTFKKGHARRGMHNSASHNTAISLANKGKPLSALCKQRALESNLGRKASEQTRLKMSQVAKAKGFGKWMLGKKIPAQVIAKRTMTVSGRVRNPEWCANISKAKLGDRNGMYGYTWSTEQLAKRGAISKANWQKPDYYQKLIATKVAHGVIKDPALKSKYVLWEQQVDRISNVNYRKYLSETGKRGRGFHLDHILSKHHGFINNLPPCIVGHICNLRVIHASANLSKNYRSGHTVATLLHKISDYHRGLPNA